MRSILLIVFVILGLYSTLAKVSNDKGKAEERPRNARVSKMLPIFQVIRFPNDVCAATSRNGTCYTSEECIAKGGAQDGMCASGFGVCCVFELTCGSTSRENVTYLVQPSTTTSMSCSYSICPCSSKICRIRYDFTTLVLNSQSTGTAAEPGLQTGVASIGDCTVDSFSISSPGRIGSPVICGPNTGYHMILDVGDSNDCQRAVFDINADATSTTSRRWDIKVTQYNCGDEDNGGPPGCLQYFTGTFGRIANYGFPTGLSASDTLGATVTHLSNQNYEHCFRRESGYCYICYSRTHGPANTDGAVINQHSFGLSIATVDTADETGQIGTDCATDYISIPGGTTVTIAALTSTSDRGPTRFCGRFLANTNDRSATAGPGETAATLILAMTVCSRSTPFRVGVYLDADEVASGTADQTNTETDGFPAGIIGFRLDWWQNSC